MTRVAVLTTYPFCKPRHGGQLRVFNIVSGYRAAGYDVSHLTVCTEETLHEAGPEDRCVPFEASHPLRSWRDGAPAPLIGDMLAGRFAATDDDAFAHVLRLLPETLDVLELEHPWLLPLAKRLLALPAYRRTKLIYSSHNIEAPLKRDILTRWCIPAADEIAAEVDALESEAAALADLCVAVSQADADRIRQWTKSRVVLAPNGISAWSAEAGAVARWKPRLPKSPFALFVGSAHPPNVTGFVDCLGDSLGFLPPDTPIVIAGGVGPNIVDALKQSPQHHLNVSRVLPLGLLPDDDLSAVKDLAHVFLLPILVGAGSNIKTAEALYSGKHVVGTPTAFRGFEEYTHTPGVHMTTSTYDSFRAATQLALSSKAPTRSKAEKKKLEALLWSHSLLPMASALRELT